MHWIDAATVESTWQDVSGLGIEKSEEEIMRLSTTQPELLAFVMASCEDLSQDAQELAVYMFLVIYRMFETAHDEAIPAVTIEHILQQDEQSDETPGDLDADDESAFTITALQQFSRQPWVMQYIVETLVEAPEDKHPVELAEEEFGQVFLLLKAVVDLLDEVTDGASFERGL